MNHRARTAALSLAAAALTLAVGCERSPTREADRPHADAGREPLRILVMDPMSLPLSCPCVQGHAQRRYEALGLFLEQRLNRPVEIAFSEALSAAYVSGDTRADLVIGKQSVVLFDAEKLGLKLRALAALSDRQGRTDLRGLFVVRRDDPAKGLKDLKGRRVTLGPLDSDEKHGAAIAALRTAGVPLPARLDTSPACTEAALAVVENHADAAVISTYALPLLEGCDTIDRGALRVIGRTAPVPFIVAFAADAMSERDRQAVLEALLTVGEQPALRTALETKAGFVTLASQSRGWTDWRGPGRAAVSADVPEALPRTGVFLWRRPLTGPGLSGVAATGRRVIVADKDPDAARDIWRCLDADTGRSLWTLEYVAAGEMDYSNAPRATPVVHEGRAYLLGALGHLHCVDLLTGTVLWKANLAEDFSTKPPAWGYAATPLPFGRALVVGVGAADASLVALDRLTGTPIWTARGEPAAYASPILASLRRRRQIVAYDATSLGGWDPHTGQRLWTLLPEHEGDFNVPTPIVHEDTLLVATENNGLRMYGFDADGRIRPKPLGTFDDLAPDTHTPVLAGGMLFGCDGALYCLDVRRGLKLLWKAEDEAFKDFTILIAGNGRVLVVTLGGELLLVRADGAKYSLVSRLRLFDDDRTEIWSHPALLGDRLYVRTQTEICCVLLKRAE